MTPEVNEEARLRLVFEKLLLIIIANATSDTVLPGCSLLNNTALRMSVTMEANEK
jgi:hypothetical protein